MASCGKSLCGGKWRLYLGFMKALLKFVEAVFVEAVLSLTNYLATPNLREVETIFQGSPNINFTLLQCPLLEMTMIPYITECFLLNIKLNLNHKILETKFQVLVLESFSLSEFISTVLYSS